MDLTLQQLIRPPYEEYITAVEVACQSLNPTDTEELRAGISRIFEQSKLPKPNLTREVWKTLKNLNKMKSTSF